MNTFSIIKVQPVHLELLQHISRKTFTETFAPTNSRENMDQYLEENLSLKRLREELNNPGSEFYFAQFDSRVIGYLKLNTGSAQTELKHEHGLEIERIYVIKDFHGQQVGQLLLETALDIARERNAEQLWLGVWEKNERAIRFYEKNGFTPFNKHIFKLGKDEQTDLMMKLQLRQRSR